MKRCICLLLAVILLVGVFPAAFAAELTGTTESPAEDTLLPTDDLPGDAAEPVAELANPPNTPTEETGGTDLTVETPAEESAPSEEVLAPSEEPIVTTEETTISTEEQEPTADDELLDMDDERLEMDGISLFAMDSSQSGILLFNYTDNGDYTTRLNYQVSCTYQLNGNGAVKTAYIKNMGWHFARYGGTPYPDNPLYCLEPYRDFAASTSGNTVDRGVTMEGSGTTAGSNVWYALPVARRQAIGQILLYSNQMWKRTNTGLDLGGWSIWLYTDANCTAPVSGSPFTTGEDGTVVVDGLTPGTYYARENPTENSYWDIDAEVKPVTVTAGQIAELTFVNTCYGRIEFHKTTNTGSHLGGWTFVVCNADGETVGTYTTDENGFACSDNLPLGRYTVTEQPTQDDYWVAELGFHDVVVTAGQSTVDTWHNKEQGLVWIYKKTNTEASVQGWQITIYSDEGCTQAIDTLATSEEGKAGYYLAPGTYWAKETGNQDVLFENEYWVVDTTVQKFEVKPHESTEIVFSNTHCGKLEIVKTVEGAGFPCGRNRPGRQSGGNPFQYPPKEALINHSQRRKSLSIPYTTPGISPGFLYPSSTIQNYNLRKEKQNEKLYKNHVPHSGADPAAVFPCGGLRHSL